MSQVRGTKLIVVYIIFFQDFALGKEELDHSSHTSSLSQSSIFNELFEFLR